MSSSWLVVLVLVLKDRLYVGAVVMRSAEAVLVLTLLVVVVDAVLVRKRLVERRSEDEANEVPRR
jgi:hypothetical protein